MSEKVMISMKVSRECKETIDACSRAAGLGKAAYVERLVAADSAERIGSRALVAEALGIDASAIVRAESIGRACFLVSVRVGSTTMSGRLDCGSSQPFWY